jgi:hypothetical protein
MDLVMGSTNHINTSARTSSNSRPPTQPNTPNFTPLTPHIQKKNQKKKQIHHTPSTKVKSNIRRCQTWPKPEDFCLSTGEGDGEQKAKGRSEVSSGRGIGWKDLKVLQASASPAFDYRNQIWSESSV